jgi:glucosylceramidase
LGQTIIGFGGAFTEAAAYVYHHALEDVRSKMMEMYFDPEKGIGYTLGRVVINSCDFSLGNYTYVRENDISLDSFDFSHEELYTVPMIKDAMKYVPKLNLMAAPWSPPAYMKTNNSMNYGGQLKKDCYSLWADYLIRYLDEMKKRGIRIEYLSIQNEPEANQVWDSCLYSPEDAAAFVKVLGPKLKKSNHQDVKVVVLDHNRDILVKWATAFAKDEEALKEVWGLGVHWYVSEDFTRLSAAKKIAPSLHLIFTEGCIEGGPRKGSMASGERYARNIIGDFTNGCEGFIDWNLCLNEAGGPNHVGNYCDAPMLLAGNGLLVNSSFYYIGHFSRFVKNGAKCLKTDITGNALQTVSFLNPDGEKIIVICNPSDSDQTVEVRLDKGIHRGLIKSHTIETWCIANE